MKSSYSDFNIWGKVSIFFLLCSTAFVSVTVWAGSEKKSDKKSTQTALPRVKKLEKKLKSCRQRLEKLGSINSRLQTKNNSLRSHLATQEKLIGKLEKNKLDRPVYPTVERLRKTLAEVNKLLATRKQKIETLKEKLATKNRRLKSFRGETVPQQRTRLKTMKSKLADKNKEIESLEDQLSELEKLLKQKSDALEKKLSRKEDQFDTCQRKLKTSRDQLDTAQHKLKLKNNRIDTLQQKLRTVRSLTENRKTELEKLQERLEKVKKAKTTRQGSQMTVTLKGTILFDPAEAKLKSSARPTLKKLTTILSDFEDYRIMVEGHTDNIPVSGGKFQSNWGLSAQRAVNVVEFLEAHSNINSEQLVAGGFGPYHPKKPNNSPENRELNRRVEIKLLPLELLQTDRKIKPESQK